MSNALLPRNVVLGSVAAAGIVAAIFVACTDSYQPPQVAGTGGSTSSTASHGGGGGLALMDAGPMCPITCSNDLTQVVDCNGVVQSTCSAMQGCANGMCIADPCTAAQVSKSSYGCDYWALKTAQRPEADGACFAAFVANTWALPVHLTVSYGTQVLTPGDVRRHPPGAGQRDHVHGLRPGRRAPGRAGGHPLPVAQQQGWLRGRMSHGAGRRQRGDGRRGDGARHRVPHHHGLPDRGLSDRPVRRGPGRRHGGHAAPAHQRLGHQLHRHQRLQVRGGRRLHRRPPLARHRRVPGQHRGHHPAQRRPSSRGRGSWRAEAGAPTMYTLNTGQFLQITQTAELTGSPITSTLPVGLFGASAGMAVPLGQQDIDSAQQQIPPVKALGSEYVAVRYRGRAGGTNEAVPWRLVGAVNGTTLTWTPAAPPGAPTSINLGDTAEFTTPGPFIVQSQDASHPFYFSGYMTGGGAHGRRRRRLQRGGRSGLGQRHHARAVPQPLRALHGPDLLGDQPGDDPLALQGRRRLRRRGHHLRGQRRPADGHRLAGRSAPTSTPGSIW